MANFETPDLAFSSKEGYGEDSGLAVYVAQAIDATLKWDDIAWLKSITSLPVVVKGVLTGELFIESVRKVFSLSRTASLACTLKNKGFIEIHNIHDVA